MRQCILASASPRRREILSNLGVPFEVVVSDVDEGSELTDPAALSEEIAARKGRAVLSLLREQGASTAGKLLIASDTSVATENEILGKPRDEQDARRMLRLLSGRSHSVVSGIYLSLDGKEAVSHAVTRVTFAPMTEEDISFYIRSGEPFGKAGAYAIQGLASAWIRGIKGDYFNVVGLPVNRMCELFFEKFGEKFL
ncbi:MAG: septum formation protein Maf [Ruminococcaceae bacterium]|nr:septum formation protein Maf [Oscillospiraceae bacterium]